MAKKATKPQKNLLSKLRHKLITLQQTFSRRHKEFLARRPHRSFRYSRKRDYMRSLKLPGYFAFSVEVYKIMASRQGLFLSMVLYYGLMTIIFSGLSSQASFNSLADSISEAGSDIANGSFVKLLQAGTIAFAVAGGSSQQLTDVQQIYLVIIMLLTWLTTVWLLRSILAGERPRLRDGLYNSAAPLVSTSLVGLLFCLQLLPIAILGIAYAGLVNAGQLENGFGLMLFCAIAVIAVSLSLYMICSTLISLVIITIPGMYPWAAIKAAGDFVVGRRLRILYRYLWLAATVVIFWGLMMVPLILFVSWLRTKVAWIDIMPIVPIASTVVSAIAVVWSASYVYLLYRKVVADDAKPA